MQIERITLEKMKQNYHLMIECWDEVDQRKAMGMIFNPDWDLYKALEKEGRLFLYNIESGGFLSIISSPDLHRKNHLMAVTDVMWIPIEQRGTLKQALPLIEKDLKNNKIDFFSITVKSREDETLHGYKLQEKTFQRAL